MVPGPFSGFAAGGCASRLEKEDDEFVVLIARALREMLDTVHAK